MMNLNNNNEKIPLASNPFSVRAKPKLKYFFIMASYCTTARTFLPKL